VEEVVLEEDQVVVVRQEEDLETDVHLVEIEDQAADQVEIEDQVVVDQLIVEKEEEVPKDVQEETLLQVEKEEVVLLGKVLHAINMGIIQIELRQDHLTERTEKEEDLEVEINTF
jgi:hypothetical protein